MNHLTPNLVGYLVANSLIEPHAPSAYYPLLEKTVRLPIILPKTQADARILVHLIAVVIIWILFLRSLWGY